MNNKYLLFSDGSLKLTNLGDFESVDKGEYTESGLPRLPGLSAFLLSPASEKQIVQIPKQ